MYRKQNVWFKSKCHILSFEMWFGILIFYLHDQNLFVYRLLSELKLEVKTTQNLKFVFCPPLEPMPPGEPVTGNTDDHIYFSDSPGLSQSNAAESTWENFFLKYIVIVLRFATILWYSCLLKESLKHHALSILYYMILDGRLFSKWNWEWVKSWNNTTTWKTS